MTLIGLHYASFGSLQRDVKEQLVHSALFLKRDMALPQFSPVTVQVVCPDGEEFELAGEIVQVMPGSATAIQVGAGAREALAQLKAHAASVSTPEPAQADDPHILSAAELAEGEETPAAEPLRAEQIPLQAQIDDMSIAELRHQCIHGNKDMRFLLARHNNKSLHSFVLKNHAIQLDEIDVLARMTSLNPNALHEISVNRDWIKSPNVVRSLVRNPKTPMPDALRLVDKLPLGEAQALVKSGALRMPLLNALKRKIRGG